MIETRSEREHKALVSELCVNLDLEAKSKDVHEQNITESQVNILIGRAEMDLKNNSKDLETRKLMRAKRNLIEELGRFFTTDGGPVNKLSIKEVKKHVLSLRIGWFERGLGTALFFLKNGNNDIKQSEDIRKKVASMISVDDPGLKDKDQMIFSEFLQVAYCAPEELLFLSSDKPFVNKGTRYIAKLKDLPFTAKMHYLGGTP